MYTRRVETRSILDSHRTAPHARISFSNPIIDERETNCDTDSKVVADTALTVSANSLSYCKKTTEY